MKRIEISHSTQYSFGAPVQLEQHMLLLRPREGHDLRIAASELNISPEAKLDWRRDYYDNVRCIASFEPGQVNTLTIASRLEVELYETMPLNFLVAEHALHFPFDYLPEEQTALRPHMEPLYQDDATLMDWLAPFRKLPADTETFTVLDKLNHQIHDQIRYQAREEPGVLRPAQMLEGQQGSCRDMATLFMESCRRLGIAARFVSGYAHAPSTEAGGASSHAWAEAYLPGAGWKGFDPTNASVVGPDHIPVAVHRDPEAIPPVAGSIIGPDKVATGMTVNVRISQLAIE